MPNKPRSHESRLQDTRWGKRKQEQYKRDRYGNAQTIRATNRWKKLSAFKRKRSPLCEDPFGYHKEDGRPTPVKDVHHIVPIEEEPSLAYSWSNLMSVCRDCHAKLDKGEK